MELGVWAGTPPAVAQPHSNSKGQCTQPATARRVVADKENGEARLVDTAGFSTAGLSKLASSAWPEEPLLHHAVMDMWHALPH